jgi:2-dehydro-3-deoxyphosphogluconate aldolase/(4S)-4-hydroxy-2-oxoglutarate aldolase
MENKFHTGLFEEMPIIGIMRGLPPEHIDIIAENYFQAGLTCLEITTNSAGAEENISRLNTVYAGRLNIGAGTVCSMHDLENALRAGAQFIVTPIINEAVIKTCVSEKIPIFPGAYTPSEIYRAWELGATMVKVFPANTLGVGYMKEVLAPLNRIKLLPTGGIGLHNFSDYLIAGAKGVGIGSSLFPMEVILKKDWETLKTIFKLYKEGFASYSRNINN